MGKLYLMKERIRLFDNILLKPVLIIFWPLNFILSLIFRKPKRRPVKSILQIGPMLTQAYIITQELKKRGYEAEYIAIGDSWLKLGKRTADFMMKWPVLPSPLSFFYDFFKVWSIYPKYDIVHIHFNVMLTRYMWELPFLKLMNILVVFHYRGGDIRQKELNQSKNPEVNCCLECDYPMSYCKGFERNHRIKMAKKYGDIFFVTTPDLKDFHPAAIHLPFLLPLMEPDVVRPAGKPEGVFRIVHATNHEGIDGTRYIIDACDRLKKEGYPVELVIVKRKPFDEAYSLYKSADLCIGKLFMGYYAKFQIESLYLGIPTMCFIKEDFLNDLEDCPIIVSKPSEVYEKIKGLMNNPEGLDAIKARCRSFVENRHSNKEIIDLLLRSYIGIFKERISS